MGEDVERGGLDTESFSALSVGAMDVARAGSEPLTEGQGGRASVDPGPAEMPARFGRYQVQAPIGVGGMGVVYLAYDRELDRHVAIKVVKGGGVRSMERQERLLAEAKAMAKVAHSNVVTIHDVGVLGDAVFVAMERIAGPTLRQWLREKPRPWRAVLDLLLRAGRGLAAIHAAGIVHRDFKPSNVLIAADGTPKVADFGLATSADGERGADRQTRGSQDRAGTPGYRSPEQVRGDRVGVGADIYAFCVTLYEALHAELPFAGLSDEGRAALSESGARSERPRGQSVPAAIEAVVDRGLRGKVEERWPTMEALLKALGRARRTRRSRLIVFGVAATAVASMILLRPLPSACPSRDVVLAEVWDGARRSSLESTLGSDEAGIGKDGATIVGAALERYVGAYAEARVEVCEAGEKGELGDWQVAHVDRCLDERRRAFAALLNLIESRGGSLAPRAAGLVERLDPVSSCRPSAAPDPEDGGGGGVEAPGVEAQLAALSVAILAEEEDVAAELLEGLSGERGPRSERLKIRLGRLRAFYTCLVGQQGECVVGYRKALRESLQRGLDLEAARASIALMRESEGAGEVAILAYNELAASLIARAGLEGEELDLIRRHMAIGALQRLTMDRSSWPEVEALLHEVRAHPSLSNHFRLDVYRLAIASAALVGGVSKPAELADEALEVARRDRGQSHPVVRHFLLQAVQARMGTGDTASALELADEAVVMSKGRERSQILAIRAVVNERLGRIREEIDDLRRGVEVCGVAGDCDATLRASLANSLAVVLDREREYDEARTLLRGVLDGPTEEIDSAILLFVRLSLADVELHSGRLRAARELFAAAHEDMVELGEESMLWLYARRGIALVDLAAGDVTAARERLEEDLDRWDDREPWERATTLFALARAVDASVQAEDERLQSTTYAGEAASIYRGLAPGFSEELAAVEAWLSER